MFDDPFIFLIYAASIGGAFFLGCVFERVVMWMEDRRRDHKARKV